MFINKIMGEKKRRGQVKLTLFFPCCASSKKGKVEFNEFLLDLIYKKGKTLLILNQSNLNE